VADSVQIPGTPTQEVSAEKISAAEGGYSMPVLGAPMKVISEQNSIRNNALLSANFSVINSTAASIETAAQDKSSTARAPAATRPAGGAPPSSMGASFVYPPQWRHGQIPKFPQGKRLWSKMEEV
jgi:hypothetical protein